MATPPTSSPPTAPTRSPFVSVSEFADYWGVSERTVWRDIAKGAIAISRVGPGQRIRILRAAMETYGRPHT